MAVTTQDELIKALETGHQAKVVGTAECLWLDFKQTAYQAMSGKPLKLSDHGRHELCKDVTAMANKRGGIILLGVHERLSEASGLSVADKITPIKVVAVDLAHYKHVLEGQIYPIVDGITLTWYAAGTGVGILAIVVPKRAAGRHIVRNVFAEDGGHLPGAAIYERVDDHIYCYPAEKIYEIITAPRSEIAMRPPIVSRADTSGQHHELFKVMRDTQKRQDSAAAEIRSQFISTNGWDDEPVMVIQCIPTSGPPRLRNFYDGVEQAFANTNPVRSSGFNLNSLGRGSDTVDGAFIKAGSRDAAIRLDPDGTLTFAIKASSDFLGWAMNKNSKPGDFIKINSIVLIETTFEFVRFISETLTTFGLNGWRYSLYIQNFKKCNVALYDGGPGSIGVYRPQRAAKDILLKSISTHKDYSRDVFDILVEVYAFFALPPRAIPYTTDSRITKEDILNLNRNLNGF